MISFRTPAFMTAGLFHTQRPKVVIP
jgi:hypothetical protein